MCKHQKTIRIPSFPSDALVCADCGQEMLPIGYANGIRDYYVPGDPPWRRRNELLKLEWLRGGEEPTQCPGCGFLGTIDDFDCLGADDDEHLFCNQCGVEFAPD